jgi:hypothetical protein
MYFRRPPRHNSNRLELLDAMMDGYVQWRDANRAVAETYHRWTLAARGERGPAFDRYAAALDREEHAAHCYRRLIEGTAATPGGGGKSASSDRPSRPVQPGTPTPWASRR